MKINKILLTGLSLFLILGCEAPKSNSKLKNTPYEPVATKLKITIDYSCMNTILNNQAVLEVKKVGGGYRSGEFTVAVGEEGTTIELPSGGAYTLDAVGKDKFWGSKLFGAKWGGTIQVRENQTFWQTLTCN